MLKNVYFFGVKYLVIYVVFFCVLFERFEKKSYMPVCVF